MQKIEYAVFVKADNKWDQYSSWDTKEDTDKSLALAKKRYSELKIVKKSTTEEIRDVYSERNGHITLKSIVPEERLRIKERIGETACK